MLSVGDRLRISRENKNLKQTQVRERTGINNKTLSGYEKGVSEPDFETLKILADLYEVSTDYLLGATTYNLTTDKTDSIIREIVKEYGLDLTIPGQREKLESIVKLVVDDYTRK